MRKIKLDLTKTNEYVEGKTKADFMMHSVKRYLSNKYLFVVLDFEKYRQYLSDREVLLYAYTGEQFVALLKGASVSHAKALNPIKIIDEFSLPLLVVLKADNYELTHTKTYSYKLKKICSFEKSLAAVVEIIRE